MKRMIVALLFAAITGFTFGQTVGEKQRKGNAEDETAVRQVVAALGETWNRHDGKAYSLLFTEDMDFVTIGGNWVRGRVDTKFTNRSGFVPWPGRPCHEAIVTRASRP